MQIQIQHGRGSDFSFGTQSFQRNNQTVECAKALPVVCTGVVKPAGQSGGSPLLQRNSRCRENATIRQANTREKLGRPRKFLRLRQLPRLASSNGRDVVRRVNPREIRFGNRIRCGNLHLRQNLPNPLRHESEFRDRHNVVAQRRGETGMVEDFHASVGARRAMESDSAG